MNVYKKFANVKDKLTNWTYDKQHPHFKYKYVSGAQILKELKPLFAEQGLLAVMKIVPNTVSVLPIQVNNLTETTNNRITEVKTPVLWLCTADLVYDIIDVDTGEKYEIPFFMTATASSGSAQAFGSALTYAERYFWLKELGLPTDEEDPDSGNTVKPSASAPTTTSSTPAPSGDTKDTVIEKIVELAGKFPEFYTKNIESKIKGTALDKLPLSTLTTILKNLEKESENV